MIDVTQKFVVNIAPCVQINRIEAFIGRFHEIFDGIGQKPALGLLSAACLLQKQNPKKQCKVCQE